MLSYTMIYTRAWLRPQAGGSSNTSSIRPQTLVAPMKADTKWRERGWEGNGRARERERERERGRERERDREEE